MVNIATRILQTKPWRVFDAWVSVGRGRTFWNWRYGGVLTKADARRERARMATTASHKTVQDEV